MTLFKNLTLQLHPLRYALLGTLLTLGTATLSSATLASDEDPHDESPAALLPPKPAQAAAAGIALAVAQAQTLTSSLPLYGQIKMDPANLQTIVARYPGLVVAVHVRLGQWVRAGELLLEIENAENLNRYPLRAVQAGRVITAPVSLGTLADKQTLVTLADTSSLWVEAAAFEQDWPQLPQIRDAFISNISGAQTSRVTLLTIADGAHTEVPARSLYFQLDNSAGRWQPNQWVQLQAPVTETPVPLAVRLDGVHTLDDETLVFVATADGFIPQPITLGRRAGGYAEVLAGLSVGDRYAAQGSFVLKSELGKAGVEHGH